MGRILACLAAILAACGTEGYVGQEEYPVVYVAAAQRTDGGETMGSAAPPSGWVVTDGVWGTDLDRDETEVLTAQASIKMLSAGGGATILSPWIATGGDDTANVQGRLSYSAFTRVKASTADPGDNATIKLHYYDVDRGLLSTSTLLNNSTVSNAWEVYGEALDVYDTVRWIRFEFTKSSAAFDLWVDGVIVQKQPAFGLHYTDDGDATQSITTGTWTRVDASPAAPNTYKEEMAEVGDRLLAYLPGVYLVTAQVTFDDLLDGETAAIYIKWTDFNSSAMTTSPSYNHCSVGSEKLTVVTSAVLPGDGFEMWVWHDGADDRTIQEFQFSVARLTE